MTAASLSGFGAAFEMRLSKAAAARILAPHPLPRMGWETTAHETRGDDWMRGAASLVVQNISGAYVLASHTHPRESWRETFGAHVPELARLIGCAP